MKRKTLALFLSAVISMSNIGGTALSTGAAEQPVEEIQEVFSDELSEEFSDTDMIFDVAPNVSESVDVDTAEELDEENPAPNVEIMDESTISGTAESIVSETEESTVFGENESAVLEGEELAFSGDEETTVFESGESTTFEYESIDDQILQENLTISGNAVFSGSGLDLNGYTLTIEGNLLHTNGSINIGGGTLEIKGDYRNAYQNTDGSFDTGYGSLVMENESDRMVVGNDFYMYSWYGDDYNRFSAGTIEIGGNFEERKVGSNFIGKGSHKVVFTGNRPHVVYMADK